VRYESTKGSQFSKGLLESPPTAFCFPLATFSGFTNSSSHGELQIVGLFSVSCAVCGWGAAFGNVRRTGGASPPPCYGALRKCRAPKALSAQEVRTSWGSSHLQLIESTTALHTLTRYFRERTALRGRIPPSLLKRKNF